MVLDEMNRESISRDVADNQSRGRKQQVVADERERQREMHVHTREDGPFQAISSNRVDGMGRIGHDVGASSTGIVMARPTHRLDIHLVPTQRDEQAVGRVRALLQRWEEAGWVDSNGMFRVEGPFGRFKRVRIDDPGVVVLYGNSVGGFQVRCPSCGRSLARELKPFASTQCPQCVGSFELEQLDCRPPVARGRASLVMVDVETAETPIPEGFVRIWRRL